MSNSTILCVDDEFSVLSALRTLLTKQLGRGYIIEIAESGQEALEVCNELQKDGRELSVIISDFIMPGMRGDELLVKVHQLSPDTVTILLTGQSDIDGIKRSINEANLYRFMEKPFNNDDIVLTTRSAHRAYHQERELEQQNKILVNINIALEGLVEKRTQELLEKNLELELLSETDKLTGLFNRHKLDQKLEEEITRSQRENSPFSLIILDLDHFKKVNDTFGHHLGDLVLIDTAKILRDQCRSIDMVGRWGGEEFLIICPATNLEGAMAVAEKCRIKIEQHIFPSVGEVTASFGVKCYETNDSVISMLENADLALYRCKKHGRNSVESSPMRTIE